MNVVSPPKRLYRIKHITGQRFGKLIVVSLAGRKRHTTYWKCLCDCGRELLVSREHLFDGHTKSCGCFRRETTSARSVTHGETRGRAKPPEYTLWLHIKARCTNPKEPSFPNYGGRGITICRRWKYSFERFLSDVGRRPEGKTLGRINNSKGYYCNNVRWETMTQQARNTRRNLILTVSGVTGCFAELCDYFQVPYQKAYSRYYSGWKLDKVFDIGGGS